MGERYGRIPAGALVAMHAGWDARIGDVDRFLNRDAKGTMHAPGFSEESARFLVSERDICAVEVDTLSLDAASAQKFVAHATFSGRRYGVEMMANLAVVPLSGATVVVGAPTHEGATGGPAECSRWRNPFRRRDAEKQSEISIICLGASATLRRDTRNSVC